MLPKLGLWGYKVTEVVDPSTVVVHLSHPVSSFLYNISIFPAFIVPKKLVQQQGNKFFNMPIGSWLIRGQAVGARLEYHVRVQSLLLGVG